MKLSHFTQGLDRMILAEEFDLDLPVISAQVTISLKRGKDIVIHKWEYEAKENKDGGK